MTTLGNNYSFLDLHIDVLKDVEGITIYTLVSNRVFSPNQETMYQIPIGLGQAEKIQ